MDVTKDGRSWRIGTASDVAWLAGHTTQGLSITTAIPPVFDAYATFYPPDGVSFEAHERAVVHELTEHTPAQPWVAGLSRHRRPRHRLPPCSEVVPVLGLALSAGRSRTRAGPHLADRS